MTSHSKHRATDDFSSEKHALVVRAHLSHNVMLKIKGVFIFAAGLYLLFSCTYAHGSENKKLNFNMPRPDFSINSPEQTVPVFNRQLNVRSAPSKPYELQNNKLTGQTKEWEKASTFFYEMFLGFQQPRELEHYLLREYQLRQIQGLIRNN